MACLARVSGSKLAGGCHRMAVAKTPRMGREQDKLLRKYLQEPSSMANPRAVWPDRHCAWLPVECCSM